MSPESSPGDSRKEFHFAYRLPEAPPPGAIEITLEEAEKRLLEKLAQENSIAAMWNLAQFYKQTGNVERATQVFRELLDNVDELESKAHVIFALGQTAERANDFDLAVRFYREALAMEPSDDEIWYWIHNNLGYSLNQLGKFVDGEECCRRALAITAKLPNAFKNLGLSLAGQGQYGDAAKCFIAATQANAGDPRSMLHLEQLLAEHPELEFEFGEALRSCKIAVAGVREKAEQLRRQTIDGSARD